MDKIKTVETLKRTFTTEAFLTEYAGVTPQAIFKPDPDEANCRSVINGLSFYSKYPDGGVPSGWTRVGVATITVEFLADPAQMVASKVESLRRKKTDILADAQRKVAEIDDDIQRLLAISYEPQS